MLTCPNCQSDLPESHLPSEACPWCGALLDVAESSQQELHQEMAGRSLSQREETEPFLAAGGKDKASDIRAVDLLSMSVNVDHDLSLRETDAPAMTVQLRALSPDDVQRMTAAWGTALSGELDAGKTIKLQSASPGDGGSSLVVRTRAISETEAPTSPGADYQLLEVIGKGGMGVVYAARQASVDRTVALKMIRSDKVGAGEHRGKFMSEAVVTGDLDHPNIVPIYELGSNESGALFYSMKRVQGIPWSKRIKTNSLEQNLEILLKVADAVAFAHANGVVHRDLKPDNVMLGDFGEVLVMDWGLALATSTFRHGDFITPPDSMGGTPSYMAPEMATGPFDRIGPASDVYLLGAILYEIVTEKRPHTGKDVEDCLMAAAMNKIQSPDTPGELLNIAYKAMATQPEDRFATVQEFQQAVREYESHSESTLLSTRAAQELAEAERTDNYQRFARALFGFDEALALWDGNVEARSKLSQCKQAYARSALGKGDYDLGVSLLDPADPNHGDVLNKLKHAQKDRAARQRRLKALKWMAWALAASIFLVVTVAFFWIRAERDRALAAEQNEKDERIKAQIAEKKAVLAQEGEKNERIRAQRAEHDARDAETKERDERIRAQNAENAAVLAQQKEAKERERAQNAEQEEKYQAYLAQIGLAASKIDENAFQDANRLLQDYSGPDSADLRHWEWGRLKFLTQRSLSVLEGQEPVDAVAFASDGKRFITGSREGVARIWSIGAKEPLITIPHPGQFVQAAAFSPDGKYVATGSSDGRARLFHAADGKLAATLKGHTDSVVCTLFSADGRWLVTTSYDKTARIWDMEKIPEAQEVAQLQGHRQVVWSAAISRDATTLLTAGQDGKVVVWTSPAHSTIPKFEQTSEFTPHDGPVYSVAFSADDSRVVTGGYDSRVLVWDARQLKSVNPPKNASRYADGVEVEDKVELYPNGAPRLIQPLDGHTGPVHAVSFSADGRLVLSGSGDNSVKVWDVRTGRLVKTLRGHSGSVQSCAFAPSESAEGRLVASGSDDGTARLWSIADYQEVRVLQGRVFRGHADAVLAAAFDPSGERIVTASRDHTARIWDAHVARLLNELHEGHAFLASAGIFRADGKEVITGAMDGTVRFWDAARGTELRALDHTGTYAAMALSPDGSRILTGGEKDPRTGQWLAHVWDAQTGGELDRLDGHRAEVSVMAWSPDGRWLATADELGDVLVWDAKTAKRAYTLKGHSKGITAAMFLPGGRRLLTASYDNSVGQWDTETGQERRELVLKHPDSVIAMAVSPDGRTVLTSCADRKVRRWDIETAAQMNVLHAQGTAATLAANVYRLMERQRWDQRDLVARSQLDEARVLRILSAETQPSDEILGALANAFGVPAAELLKPLVSSLSFSPDGRRALAVNSEDHTVLLWDLAPEDRANPATPLSPRLLLDVKSQGGSVWSARFSPDGNQVLTVGGNDARLWQADSGREVMSYSPHAVVASASFSPDGKYVVTGSWDHTARIWDIESGRCVTRLTGEHAGRVNSAVFSPVNGSLLLTASDDRTARLWKWDPSTREAKPLKTLEGHEQRVLSAAFSQDGRQIVTASSDKTARIWDALEPVNPLILQGHTGPVVCARFSPDGKWVITGSEDNTAMIWQLGVPSPELYQLRHTLQGHTAGVTTVAFSPDGWRALTGSHDRSAKLWDARQGSEILNLSGHTQGVTSVSFSPSGLDILTSSRDGTAVLWLADDWREPPH